MFDSAFVIGQYVRFSPNFNKKGYPAAVVGVTFVPGKVCYDLELECGGEPLRNVDSSFVHYA